MRAHKVPVAESMFKKPWFFRGTLVVSRGTRVEIRRIRFSPMRRAFEAQEVLDTVTGVLYRADGGWQPCEAQWHDLRVEARLEQVVIEPLESQFTLAPIGES